MNRSDEAQGQLESFSVFLNQKAIEGQVDPLIGRMKLIDLFKFYVGVVKIILY